MLARAAVAECGWRKRDCHAAVWHALELRWEDAIVHRPAYTLVDQITGYCAVWKGRARGRKRWVRSLPAMEVSDGGGTFSSGVRFGHNVYNGRGNSDVRRRRGDTIEGPIHGTNRPRGWPVAASWPRHARMWRGIYERAGAFLRGEVSNPCRGEPTHFGAGGDVARMSPAKWRFVECGNTGRQKFWEAR